MSAATPPTPTGQEPHAVCVPFPTQGHITSMLKLAKILHARGFRVTFVNTEYNHRRRRGPHGVPLRHHQLRHQAQLPASLAKPARWAGRRDVRRGGQPDELQRGRRQGGWRAVRALLDAAREVGRARSSGRRGSLKMA